MKILTTTLGFVLIFETTEDLQGRIEHLEGLLEWTKSENIPPPHLYAVSDERIPKEEVQILLDSMKLAPELL